MIVSPKEILISRTDNSKIHLIRSIISSTVSFMIDFSILIVLVEKFHIYYIIGGIAGFIIGTTVLYFFSILWIFKTRRIENIYLEYLYFIILGIIGGALNILLLWLFTDKFNVYYMFSRMIAASIVFFFNFLSRKILLFTKPDKNN